MKTPKPLTLLFILLPLCMTAQRSWYQQQDGGLQPSGTYAAQIISLTRNAVAALYLYKMDNDQFTWKLSKTTKNGTEQSNLFVNGEWANAEIRKGYRQTIYLLLRTFPFASDPQYTVYKLDSSLHILAQRSVSFPNGFSIYNLNAFETDDNGNVYLAGDGQFPDGPGYTPASFVIKTDRNLNDRWSRVDTVQTSYTRLHINRNGNILLVEDFYTFFPDIRVQQLNTAGQRIRQTTYATDPGRLSIATILDRDDNLLVYGAKEEAGYQSFYLNKIARTNGNIVYRKNWFPATGTWLNDFKLDEEGMAYALLGQYTATGPQCRIARIQPRTGNLFWTKSFSFVQDSCELIGIVPAADKVFLLGNRKSGNFFSKGYYMELTDQGQRKTAEASPDSVLYGLNHRLITGVAVDDGKFIALGNTCDLDTLTGISSFNKAFAFSPGRTRNEHDHDCDDHRNQFTQPQPEKIIPVIYPSPAINSVNITHPELTKFSRVILTDLWGHPLAMSTTGGTTVHFDLSRYAAGTYVLKLQSANPARTADQQLFFTIRR